MSGDVTPGMVERTEPGVKNPTSPDVGRIPQADDLTE
jgi:hypothetical protein